jgi:hypothetical protein
MFVVTEKGEEDEGLNTGEIQAKRVRKSCVEWRFIVVTVCDVLNGGNEQ